MERYIQQFITHGVKLRFLEKLFVTGYGTLHLINFKSQKDIARAQMLRDFLEDTNHHKPIILKHG